MNKKTLFSLIIALIIIFSALFSRAKKTQAVGLLTPFGGRITYVTYCCNGIAIAVAGEKGSKNFFLDWASLANPTVNYANYNVFVPMGQPTVGEAAGIAECITIESECESPYTIEGGTVIKIGTGLI